MGRFFVGKEGVSDTAAGPERPQMFQRNILPQWDALQSDLNYQPFVDSAPYTFKKAFYGTKRRLTIYKIRYGLEETYNGWYNNRKVIGHF